VAAACGVTIPLATARAQEAPPFDPAIDVQLFEYAIGPKTFFAVADASLAGKGQLAIDAFITFLTDPFTIYNVNHDEEEIVDTRTEVVQSVLAGDLSAAYGLSERFQLGVDLPILFQVQGEGVTRETATADPMGLQVSGTGDLRAEVKARVWSAPDLAIAGALGVSLPTSYGSGGGKFIGDDLPTLRGRMMGQWTAPGGKVSLGANLGLVFRKPRTIYASTVGQQMTWGVAGTVRATARFALIGELFGRTGLGSFDLDASPMEVEGGLRVQATRAVSVVAGGGGGLVSGIGSPELRVFASVGWAPDTRDTDGDRVANNRDDCPSVPEDHDGWQDVDGCPEDDNDGDQRPDVTDRCPNESEDFDGWEDDDGCPELDNDGDGYADLQDTCPLDREDSRQPFPTDGCPAEKRDVDQDGLNDVLDRCPTDAEDEDGFEDWDGCPDPDQDKDGVADDADQCPLCSEDVDGFADDDGCPELDNDADGLLDAGDRCPDEAETVNGIDDLDGCPDEGGVLIVEVGDDRLTMLRTPTFDPKTGALNRGGQIITDQMGLQMMRHPEITKWTIAVAAVTQAEAQKQADAMVARLGERGVERARLEVVTSAGTPQLGVLISARLEEPAAACPAGKQAVPRPAPAPTAPATPPVAPPLIPPTTAPVTPPTTAPVTPPTTGPVTPPTTPPTTAPVTPPTTTPPATPPATTPSTGTPANVLPVFAAWTGVQPRIAFERDKMKLAKGSGRALDELAVLLRSHPRVIVTIAVHSDDARPAAESQVITENQAMTARAYLLGKGVAPDQVQTVGKGSSSPLPGATAEQNRRVELSFR
jgi:outer membrane protein OmpA-like peptidoglycan-associated protein